MLLKKLILSILLLVLFQISAQNNRWIDMFSYLKINNIQATDDRIIAQSENTFFIYYIDSGEIEKLSSVTGLSGDEISNFYYHPGLKKLFIFHTGGLIEVVDEQKNVFKSSDLRDNTFVQINQKVLNGLAVRGNLLYLATGYGISVYDLEHNEFADTYYIGAGSSYINVKDVAVLNQQIYAATPEGLKTADLNDNLLDVNVWSNLNDVEWEQIKVFDEKLIASKDNEVYELTPSGMNLVLQFTSNIKKINVNRKLNIAFESHTKLFAANYVLETIFYTNGMTGEKFNAMIDAEDDVYIATTLQGVLKSPANHQSYTAIRPSSPLSNHVYKLDARQKKLWIVYGDYNLDDDFNPFPLYKEGISSFQDNHWINIPYTAFEVPDLSFVKINPVNTDEVYISSTSKGLLRIRNNQPDMYYNGQNSPLDSYGTNNELCFVYALDYDSQGNVWVTHRGNTSLFKIDPDGNWQGINLQGVLTDANDNHGFAVMKIDKNDIVWIGTLHKGVLGYNPQTGQMTTLSNGFDPQDYTIVTGLDIDKDNIMWAGNIYELRTLSEPERMFYTQDLTFAPIKIVYEDAVQLLLEGQNISAIKVDGSNNKWISTVGSGVYYFNEDGTKTIYHFTKENSPLPSNEIYDLAIDGSTGIVYFASLNGLVAFKGNATDPADEMNDVYAFPNPVNQRKHNTVTIRGLVEGVSVKIVDVEGNLVYETIAKGGSVDWDLTAFGKYKVASGVYIALITNEDGTKTQTTKILVIK